MEAYLYGTTSAYNSYFRSTTPEERVSNPTAESDPSRGDAVFGQMARITGRKQYELNDHLGNVLSTISDHRIGVGSSITADYYTADVRSAQDYYPFGMLMNDRKNASTYRFGYNGKEKDNEVKGEGNSLDFGARMLDTRLGRWLSLDPLRLKYASLSPFNFAVNCPLKFIDPDGRDIKAAGSDQKNLSADFKSKFGKEISSKFGFNPQGILIFTGDMKSTIDQVRLTNPDQADLLLGVNYLMNDKTVTNVTYSNAYTLHQKDGTTAVLDPQNTGGECEVDITSSPKAVNENYVVISPDRKSNWGKIVEYVSYYPTEKVVDERDFDGNKTGRQIREKGETTNPNDRYRIPGSVPEIRQTERFSGKTDRPNSLFHGLGYTIYQNNNQRGYVIDFENKSRRINGSDQQRPYDQEHTDKTGSDPLKGYVAH